MKAKGKQKIELNILEQVEQLRVSEASLIKNTSFVTIHKCMNDGLFNLTKNNLIINDDKFKSWKRRKYKSK